MKKMIFDSLIALLFVITAINVCSTFIVENRAPWVAPLLLMGLVISFCLILILMKVSNNVFLSLDELESMKANPQLYGLIKKKYGSEALTEAASKNYKGEEITDEELHVKVVEQNNNRFSALRKMAEKISQEQNAIRPDLQASAA